MNNIKRDFTIKDLENISGIKAHTIRIWEKRYGLLQPQRTNTNIRYYSNQNLTKLLNIVLLNKNNYKISKIAQMSEDMITLNARELAFKIAVNDEAINSFKLAMFQFDKVLFNTTYNKLLHKKTFRDIFKDIFIPLVRRVEIAGQVKADIFVSIHFNSSTNRQAEGIEVYYYSPKPLPRNRASKQLANYVLPKLIDQTGANSRGVKAGNFHVIRETSMPAVLVEAGFITNAQERQKIRQRQYLNQIAMGIAQGIDNYFKMNKCPRRELNARPAA